MATNGVEARHPVAVRRCLISSLVLAVAGVAAGIWASAVSDGIVLERGRTCNGMLAEPAWVFVLAWLAVTLAATSMVTAVVGRGLMRPRAQEVAADAVLACLTLGIAALLVAVATLAGLAAVLGVLFIAGAGVLRLRSRAPAHQQTAPRPAPGWLISALAAVALLAVLVTLFLLSAVYSDAPTTVHLCSG